MPALIEKYEFVKEFIYVFDGLDPKIQARISKILLGANAQYTWEINYYCRKQGEADVYVPGAPFGNTLEEIQHKLDLYIERFNDAVDIRANSFY